MKKVDGELGRERARPDLQIRTFIYLSIYRYLKNGSANTSCNNSPCLCDRFF